VAKEELKVAKEATERLEEEIRQEKSFREEEIRQEKSFREEEIRQEKSFREEEIRQEKSFREEVNSAREELKKEHASLVLKSESGEVQISELSLELERVQEQGEILKAELNEAVSGFKEESVKVEALKSSLDSAHQTDQSLKIELEELRMGAVKAGEAGESELNALSLEVCKMRATLRTLSTPSFRLEEGSLTSSLDTSNTAAFETPVKGDPRDESEAQSESFRSPGEGPSMAPSSLTATPMEEVRILFIRLT